jgi:hypothetical protein
MSSERELTRIVRSWLEEGVNVLPDRVLDDVLDRLPTTPQRLRWWQAWRNPTVTNAAKFMLAGAAVVVVAVLGIGIYLGQTGGLGGPGPTPSQSPPAASQGEPGETLTPARYMVRPEPFLFTSPRVVVTVPAGYQGIGNGANAWSIVKVGDSPSAFSGLGVWQVDTVYEDPCRWSSTGGGQSLGPTVDDFVAALAGQPGRDATEPTNVTVDGFSGKRLQVSVPADVAFDGAGFPDCDEGEYRSWPGRYHQAPSQIDDIRVLDVNGKRLIIATTYFLTTSSADRAELDAMVQSLDIEP